MIEHIIDFLEKNDLIQDWKWYAGLLISAGNIILCVSSVLSPLLCMIGVIWSIISFLIILIFRVDKGGDLAFLTACTAIGLSLLLMLYTC